ncbi:FtsX-like permease family protein, partial [Coprobacillus cateniformis]|nr:FtsX-like permease family protein [Coprobacillus cateniformis]
VTQTNGRYMDINYEDNYYNPESFYRYDDMNKDQLIDFNNGGSFYVNYQTIKNIRFGNTTIQDYVNQNINDSSNEKEMMRIIKEAVKKYESQIVNSKIKLSISSDIYLENIIDKIAGVYIDLSHEESHSFVLKDTLIQKYNLKTDGYSECLIAPIVDDEMLKDIISYTYNDNIDQSSYILNNQVMPMLSSVNSVISTLENVFFYIGIGFAVFASIMFCNFIATSIANKKREIGILRAVGARGVDVLKIFLNESLMIAVINWILSVIVCFAGVTFINQYIRNEFGVLVTILNFGLLQIVLLLIISIAVACIASAIPVYKISKKKPIDAIKNRK